MTTFYVTVSRYDLAGGVHFWPTVRTNSDFSWFGDPKRTLTARGAARCNRDDGREAGWKAGDKTSKFDDEQEAVKESILCAVDHAVRSGWKAPILILRGSLGSSPLPVLYCSDDQLGAKLSALNSELEGIDACDPWSVDSKRANEICAEWDELIEESEAGDP